MKTKIAVKDANVFIDMEYMGILDLWFQLGYDTLTSDLVVRELENGMHLQAIACVESSQIRALSLPLDVIAELQESYVGISSTDAAVLHIAIEHKALLITGDSQLRNAVSFCGLKCTTFLRVKVYHLEMLILLIFSIGFVENFMRVCFGFC